MENNGVDLALPQRRVHKTIAGHRKIVIFTDLDGAVLDSSYSHRAADEALRAIRLKDVPLVICSSKTRSEIEYYRQKMETYGPFISENGGAVFVPRSHFSPETENSVNYDGNEEYLRIIRLGAVYRELREVLTEMRSRGFHVRGFGDMSVPEIARLTGLPEYEARLAARREFDEPFVLHGDAETGRKIIDIIRSKGLAVTRGGVFFHLLGHTDKGRAASIVAGMYRREFGPVFTVALGDGPNDLAMLKTADLPIIVRKPDGSYDPELEREDFHKADGAGPKGWNDEVLRAIGLA